MYSLAFIASHAEALYFAQGAASVLVGALFVTKAATETRLKLLQYISTYIGTIFPRSAGDQCNCPPHFCDSPF